MTEKAEEHKRLISICEENGFIADKDYNFFMKEYFSSKTLKINLIVNISSPYRYGEKSSLSVLIYETIFQNNNLFNSRHSVIERILPKGHVLIENIRDHIETMEILASIIRYSVIEKNFSLAKEYIGIGSYMFCNKCIFRTTNHIEIKKNRLDEYLAKVENHTC